MTPEIPQHLLDEAAEWNVLHRWERSQLGKALRSLGLTYSEIQAIVPVPSGTLSNWSRDIVLAPAQIDAIKKRTGPHTQRGVPKDTQWRRRLEVEAIRAEARTFAESHLDDPAFVGGVVLYWGEGAKTRSYLDLSNSDPAALRAFIRWARTYLDSHAEFVLSLHLHEGNDEPAAREYWGNAIGLHSPRFTKTFIKPAGTGHRKNHLEHGVCRVRTLRAADHWNRIMVWIDVVASWLGPVEDPPC
jgi:hypothetical protein